MSSFSSTAFSTAAFSAAAFDMLGVVQPVLPIHKPGFRSIDAKTLADQFNRGQPVVADYEWPNRRRFYQEDQ